MGLAYFVDFGLISIFPYPYPSIHYLYTTLYIDDSSLYGWACYPAYAFCCRILRVIDATLLMFIRDLVMLNEVACI
jgi:hypothetical protein